MAENMSFLPEDYLAKRVAKRTNIICISLFAVVMVGVVAAWFVQGRQWTEIRQQQAAVDKQYEEAARRLEQLEQLQAQKSQMIRKAKIASVLVERVPRTLLLAELVNHMPSQLSLLELELKTETKREAAKPRTALDREKGKPKKGVAASASEIQAPVTDATLKLVGVATTDVEVAQFIQAMSSHDLFKDVTLEYSEQTVMDEKDLRKFAVLLKLNQEVDLRTLEPTLVKRDLKMDPMGNTIQIAPEGLVNPGATTRPVADAH